MLRRKKFKFSEENIVAVIDGIVDRAIFVDGDKIDIELPDPKDLVFYEVVVEARKEEEAYLVTGNLKHFPIETFVVTPAEMILIINSD